MNPEIYRGFPVMKPHCLWKEPSVCCCIVVGILLEKRCRLMGFEWILDSHHSSFYWLSTFGLRISKGIQLLQGCVVELWTSFWSFFYLWGRGPFLINPILCFLFLILSVLVFESGCKWRNRVCFIFFHVCVCTWSALYMEFMRAYQGGSGYGRFGFELLYQ